MAEYHNLTSLIKQFENQTSASARYIYANLHTLLSNKLTPGCRLYECIIKVHEQIPDEDFIITDRILPNDLGGF